MTKTYKPDGIDAFKSPLISLLLEETTENMTDYYEEDSQG